MAASSRSRAPGALRALARGARRPRPRHAPCSRGPRWCSTQSSAACSPAARAWPPRSSPRSLVGVWAGAAAAAEEPLPSGSAGRRAGAHRGRRRRLRHLLGALRRHGADGARPRARTPAPHRRAPPTRSDCSSPCSWAERGPGGPDSPVEEEGWGALGALVLGFARGDGGGRPARGPAPHPLARPGPLLLGRLRAPPRPPRPPRSGAPGAARSSPLRGGDPLRDAARDRGGLPGRAAAGAAALPERRGGVGGAGAAAARPRWPTSRRPRAGSPAGPARRALPLPRAAGAYTLPRRIAERDPRARITVVELDPEVTRVAYRFFGLRRDARHRLASTATRAPSWSEAPTARFDRIYLDVYTGAGVPPLPARHPRGLRGDAPPPRPRRAGRPQRHRHDHRGPKRPGSGRSSAPSRERLPRRSRSTGTWGPTTPSARTSSSRRHRPGSRLPPRAGLFERWPEADWLAPRGALVFRDLFPAPLRRRSRGSR